MVTANTIASAEYVIAFVGLASVAAVRIEQALHLSANRPVRYRKADGLEVDVVLLGDDVDLTWVNQTYPGAKLLRVEDRLGWLALSRPGTACRMVLPFLARQVLSALDRCLLNAFKLEKRRHSSPTSSEGSDINTPVLPDIDFGLAQRLLGIRPHFPGGTGALVVDDNPESADALAACLTGFGIRTHRCHNAMEALKQVQKAHYQLLFVDAQMPVVDGFSLTRSVMDVLVENPPLIVMLNNRAGMWFRQRAAAAGAVATLSKPIKPEMLSNVISELFANSAGSHITPSIKA